MIQLKQTHAVAAFIIMISSPILSGVASYYQALSQLAPKAEVEKMRDKVDRIAEDVAEIKGLLKARDSTTTRR